jgi:hypothetical protein
MTLLLLEKNRCKDITYTFSYTLTLNTLPWKGNLLLHGSANCVSQDKYPLRKHGAPSAHTATCLKMPHISIYCHNRFREICDFVAYWGPRILELKY